MKKLLLFSIFIGIFCSPVTYAASSSLPNNIGAIWNNDKYYICKEEAGQIINSQLLNNQSSKNVVRVNNSIHSLGKISYSLPNNPVFLYPTPATAYKFTCQSNGKFEMEDPDYCRTSLHKDNTSFLNFGRYRLLSNYLDRSYHNTNAEQLESARTLSYASCIHIGCETGYIYNDANNTCENINTITNAICKTAKPYNLNEIPELIRKLHTKSNPQYYQCGQTPGISNPGCLTVDNLGLGLYCMTKEAIGDSIKKDDEGLLKQTCIENENYIILPPPSNHSKPYPYYQCTANGWLEKTLEPCIASKLHCENDPNCELDIFTKSDYNSGTYELITTFLSVTSINNYCYAPHCKTGFVVHNNQCISEQQKACIDSFGTWAHDQCTCDPSKGLEPDRPNKTCKCKQNHERDERNKICVPTDTEAKRQACIDMDNNIATWDEANEQCTCHESGYEWKYDATSQSGACEKLATRAACEDLGTHIARWDTDHDECKCNDNGQEFNGTQCVDTAATIKRKANDASRAITDAVNTLDNLNLQTSKWKNAEGKFNTARLASDATAGIVLGTTSALITSKLVKKHQVQDGFEDIHCTIGGQTVADWGDEFTIGIQ